MYRNSSQKDSVSSIVWNIRTWNVFMSVFLPVHDPCSSYSKFFTYFCTEQLIFGLVNSLLPWLNDHFINEWTILRYFFTWYKVNLLCYHKLSKLTLVCLGISCRELFISWFIGWFSFNKEGMLTKEGMCSFKVGLVLENFSNQWKMVG